MSGKHEEDNARNSVNLPISALWTALKGTVSLSEGAGALTMSKGTMVGCIIDVRRALKATAGSNGGFQRLGVSAAQSEDVVRAVRG